MAEEKRVRDISEAESWEAPHEGLKGGERTKTPSEEQLGSHLITIGTCTVDPGEGYYNVEPGKKYQPFFADEVDYIIGGEYTFYWADGGKLLPDRAILYMFPTRRHSSGV